MELDYLVEYVMLKYMRSQSKFLDLLWDIFEIGLQDAKMENEAPMIMSVSTEFRRLNKRRRRADVFAKFFYENNNRDGKNAVDLKPLVSYLKNQGI